MGRIGVTRDRGRLRHLLVAALMATVLVLSACAIRQEFREDFETAIPTALLDADLGVTDATAEKTLSGFAVGIWVGVTFDHTSVSADELRATMEIVVAHANVSGLDELTIVGFDGTTDDEFDTIDLAPVGAELGFPITAADPDDFSADWDDVVAYLNEAQD